MKRLPLVMAALAAVTLLPGCARETDSARAGGADIVIGASIPLSGALASTGGAQKWGYEHAVTEINAAGGIMLDGTQHRARLVLLDDRSDANLVGSNIDALVAAHKAVALLGSCTSPLVIAGAVAAERNSTPLVSGCAPLVSFTSARQWTWAWDIHYFETDLAAAPFQTLQDLAVTTNHRIAILHDNSADGTALGGTVWPALAKQHGYTVAVNVEFATDTTDFSALVQQAKSARADVLLVDAVTAQAASIRKQLATSRYTPRVLVMERGAEAQQFAAVAGGLADGVLFGGYWDASFAYPGAAALKSAYVAAEKRSVSQHIAGSYTAARVLLDAIAAASSLDRQKINAAIGATDRSYPVGAVKFSGNHAAVLGVVELQWQGGEQKAVWPRERATAALMFPPPAGK